MRRAIEGIRPDVLNIHNIHDVLDFGFVRWIPNGLPQVWTLHDMWTLTGGCLYSYECPKWTSGCHGFCPQESIFEDGSESARDGWLTRERFFLADAGRRVLVCPSKWLTEMARQRFPNLRVETIPNGVDTNVYRPLEKRHCRDVLGLPLDGAIILAGGTPWGDVRKGGGYLDEALASLPSSIKNSVMAVGLSASKVPATVRAKWTSATPVKEDLLMSLYYNAADVFVLPSLADNLPNTILESLACGTPCIVFDVGGCREPVREGETGFIARYKDVGHLSHAIQRAIAMNQQERERMRLKCRAVALQEYGLDLQAKRYAQLFEEISQRS